MTASLPSSLSEKGGVPEGQAQVIDVLIGLRRRFVNVLTSLPDADWERPSRCSEWTVHDVARHVRDVARVHIDQLSTDGRAFDAETFDSRKTPLRWLTSSRTEAPEQTLTDLDDALTMEGSLLARRAEGTADQLWRGPAGRTLHPLTFSLHVRR
jgi:hypothetical protein